MAGVDQSQTFPHLLSQQLHGLSELCETFTLRLLELEERFSKLENHLSEDHYSESSAQKLLVESEERVKHLQELLDVVEGSKKTLTLIDKDLGGNESTGSTEINSDQKCVQIAGDYAGEQVNEFLSADTDVKSGNDADKFEEIEYIDDSEMPLLSA